jgi:hypothetical protein
MLVVTAILGAAQGQLNLRGLLLFISEARPINFVSFLFVAYFVGAIPASVGGILFATIGAGVRTHGRRLAVAAAAGAAASVMWFPVSFLKTGQFKLEALFSLAIFAAIGAGAGFACAWIALRIGLDPARRLASPAIPAGL